MVDTQGDPLGVQVVPADTQDRDALHALGPDLGTPPVSTAAALVDGSETV
jgi:hypothetical protein